MREEVLICIRCPLGCTVTLRVNEKNEICSMIGNQCKEGKDYIISEFQAPVRVFTTTILTEKGRRLLPVKTDKPVNKNQLKEIMLAIAKLKVEPPIKIGQVIIPNILGTRANLIATSNINNSSYLFTCEKNFVFYGA